ncbi:MAG: methyltransferase domain-containing protein [bacterium JZ-2024 1]
MLTFRVEFGFTSQQFVRRALYDSARLFSLSIYGAMPGQSPPAFPTIVLFHRDTGAFGTIHFGEKSLSFRLEHPAHLSSDSRVKKVFFGFARKLCEELRERLIDESASVKGSDQEKVPPVRLKPDLPESTDGLRFGESPVWDEWNVASGGADLWNFWREQIQDPGGQRFYGNRIGTYLEIGFGSGDFLAEVARERPSDLFIGVESSVESIRYAVRKVRDLHNVHLVHADGITFLRYLCPPATFDAIFVHFPYPWDKKRYRHRRIFRADTIGLFARALSCDGFLQVVTDSGDYAADIAHLVRRSSRWILIEYERSVPPALKSRYLGRWLSEGRAIWTLRARLQAAPNEPPVKSQWRPGLLPLTGTIHRFPLAGNRIYAPTSFLIHQGKTVVRLEGSYRDKQDRSRLLRLVVVAEDGVARRYYLLLTRTQEGRGALEVPEGARVVSPLDGTNWVPFLAAKLQEEILKSHIPDIFRRLLSEYGPQGWWPVDREYHLRNRSDYRDEIAIGSILTQATTWHNVENALHDLKERGALSLTGILQLPRKVLVGCLRAARFPEVKADRLLAFAHRFLQDYQNSWKKFRVTATPAERRNWLLKIKGIGEETADSILLYAVGDPFFVIDAYTRRLFSRMGYTRYRRKDEGIRTLVQDGLSGFPENLREFHALIVQHAKTMCKSRVPLCGGCPLLDLCAFPQSAPRTDLATP